jgi:hypothetical protein
VRLAEDAVELDPGQGNGNGLPEDAPVLCRLKVLNETPVIPDLERLESKISEILHGGS